MILHNFADKLEDNISLSEFTTFRIGGKAKSFIKVSSLEELKEAVAFAKENKLPILVLGSGSNVLVSDNGFSGLVIQIAIQGIEYSVSKNENSNENNESLRNGGEVVRVTAQAGVLWSDLVKETVERGLFGLENLSGIPGTVGAAPIQNIGAYGTELEDTFASLKVFDIETMSLRTFSKEESKFGYRDSIFKKKGGEKFIVTEITVELKKSGPVNISYPDLAKFFAGKNPTEISALDIHKAVLQIRKEKLPDPFEIGTAGSFFKNPIIPKTQFIEIQKKFKDMPFFPTDPELVKIPAGWLLDKVCNLKGYRKGKVGTYPKQALALVNYGGASAKEVTEFAKMIQDMVKEKTGIELEWEVRKIGV